MRQAIVIIHGIGEPRPMRALRSFIEGTLGDESDLKATVRSKPDRLSESYELRRLAVDGSRSRPATDCFEYYWAHHMEGNRIGHVWPLARLLLLRWPWRVPGPLMALWTTSWVLIVLVIGLGPRLVGAASELRLTAPMWWAFGTIALGLLQIIGARYLGDAARYLSATPENVSIRQKIRAEGIQVVRRIQESRNYDRIVIVGHSLGSVIGYDVITHLWDECNTVHAFPDRPKQDALRRVEVHGRELTCGAADRLKQFRDDQRALWQEQRVLGNSWLISDFITIGSPLTYGAILFATDKAELKRRQADRELPRCPPVRDEGKYAYRSQKYYVRGAPRTLRVLHHAAPFAVTRWTNIYVPLRLGVLGDWIGGPLRPVFGCGIEDVPVEDSPFCYLPLLSHTRYWRKRSAASLAAVRTALDLNSKTWLRPPRATEGSAPAVVGPPETEEVPRDE